MNATMPMLARARNLRDAGLSYEAIVRVLRLDYGAAPHKVTVRRHLGPDGQRETAGIGAAREGNLPIRAPREARS